MNNYNLIRNGLWYIIITIIIFSVLSLISPEAGIGTQLAFAFVVNWLFYDFTNNKRLLSIFNIRRHQYLKQLEKVLSGNDNGSELDSLRENAWKIIALDRILTIETIEKATVSESVGLLLSLQNCSSEYKIDDNADNSHLKSLAIKACKYRQYRRYLFKKSISSVNIKNVDSVFSKIDSNKSYHIGNDLKTKSDNDFNRKLKNSTRETVYIFSTTSQMSADLIDLFECYDNTICQINFFICSPLILSNKALNNLSTEYLNPQLGIPQGQFVIDAEGNVNEQVDQVRRIIRILSSIHRLIKLKERYNLCINLYLFNDSYPGFKFKALKNKKFAQLQPGALSFANNLYRHGYDITDSEIFDTIISAVDEYKNSDKITFVESQMPTFDLLKEKATKECAIWLLKNNLDQNELVKYTREINSLTKEVFANEFINSIRVLMMKSFDVINNSSPYALSPNEKIHVMYQGEGVDNIHEIETENGLCHISVGIIIVRDEKVLLIKKAHKQYRNKYSIIAGHLNNNETPYDAILRETKEEIGVSLKEAKYMAYIEDVKDQCRYGANIHNWYLFHSYDILDESNLKIDRSEILDYEWVGLSSLIKYKDRLTFGSRYVFETIGYL